MKFSILSIISAILISCVSKRNNFIKQKFDFEKYELAYESITKKINQIKPFLNEYESDASGVKIIPRIFQIKNYSIYGIEYFKTERSYENKGIRELSKKYSQSNWRNDNEYKTLQISELKNFHGPLNYIYFSEIRNDSLRAEILANPNAKYLMTTGEHYLIIFEKKHINSIQKTIGNYD